MKRLKKKAEAQTAPIELLAEPKTEGKFFYLQNNKNKSIFR